MHVGTLMLLLAGISLAAQPAGTQSHRAHFSPELDRIYNAVQNGTIAKNQKLNIIVQFTQKPTQHHFEKMHRLGGFDRHHLQLINGGAFNISVGALLQMANDPEILRVSTDRAVHATSADAFEPTVGGDVAHASGWDGTGITVAVIDSGINDHPDLHDPVTGASRVIYSQTFVPGTDTSDGYGHGTHVAGIIAGNGSVSNGAILGVAPHAKLINFKVLDSTGAGSDSYTIAAIQQAIALKSTYNISILNLSLGRPVSESFTTDPLCQAVEAAWQAGLVVVVAAAVTTNLAPTDMA